MRVAVQESKPAFRPVVLKMVIESEQELLDLWHRLLAPAGWLKKVQPDGARFEGLPLTELCDAIDAVKESRKLDAYYPVPGKNNEEVADPKKEQCSDCGEVHGKPMSLHEVLIKMAQDSEKRTTRRGEL
jgi:hypothetical protein